ncbi:MAG: Rpn family recombination-promoting nuclease/putative transposase [Planctomycetaceae bacterium]|jgi:predicted transposase/invertase (TIGR01784 family)|nr:Rpn family recombination-promoting nuclease/putative transposase [Planctomycetaceae bacterium]
MPNDKSKQKKLLEKSFVDESKLNDFKKQFQHDAFCRNKLTELKKARGFLKHVLKPEVRDLVDLEQLEVDPESYIDEQFRKYYVDVLYRIPLKNSEEHIVLFILIELKTKSEKWTIFQIVKYIVLIWTKEFERARSEKRLRKFRFSMIIPLIFHHGKGLFTAPTEMIKLVRVIKGLEQYVLNVKAMLFDVSSLESKDFPNEKDDLGLYILFMTLQMVFSEDAAERLMEIYRKLRPTINSLESQKEWNDALQYATKSAKHFSAQDIKNVKNQIKKEGVVMSVSALDSLVAEYKAEGEARGEIKGVKKTVLNILRAKFKMPNIPRKIKAAIQRIDDPVTLDSLNIRAAVCQTFDEFVEALN